MNFNNIPIVTKYLIIINVIVFAFTEFLAPQLSGLFSLKYFQNPDFGPWQIITSMFTHGGTAHIFFNMFALFMFGSAIEKAWGPKKYLQLYFIAGIGAVLLHQGVQYFQVQSALSQLPSDALSRLIDEGWALTYPSSESGAAWQKLVSNFLVPSVGASGAIYGILVAFGMLFPNTKLMFIFLPVPIKAKYFIPIGIIVELFLGVGNFSWDNIAHFAHLGGALVGFIFVMIWKKNKTVFY